MDTIEKTREEKMKIRKAIKKDFNQIVDLALKLWPNHSREELEKEFASLFNKKDEIIFVAISPSEEIIGFASASIRRNNLPGVSCYPAGYLEGIYIEPEFRKNNLAKKLVSEVEKWARLNQCKILVSDSELNNLVSQKFHNKLGFKETKRLVFFEKKIK